jgi:hypothetical protein
MLTFVFKERKTTLKKKANKKQKNETKNFKRQRIIISAAMCITTMLSANRRNNLQKPIPRSI